ncbi:hypothetical protein K402DRAFT_392272 [Aulographum hederae CBS 113979]|uniref:Uncharacterized protein n=1 Tax=Aulographum hederae CBS 113979 TaxID=1176131 RepID=A0A6G1H453_9PEZI|nr:hypothetical protein K402DRAFT_392272 [Aulographum hederae CBS 113979]
MSISNSNAYSAPFANDWSAPRTLNGLSFIEEPLGHANQSLYQSTTPPTISTIQQPLSDLDLNADWNNRRSRQHPGFRNSPHRRAVHQIQTTLRPTHSRATHQAKPLPSPVPYTGSGVTRQTQPHSRFSNAQDDSRLLARMKTVRTGTAVGSQAYRPGTHLGYSTYAQRTGQYDLPQPRGVFSSAGPGRRVVRR